MPSAPDDSCSDKMKGTCHRSPFGMMFVPSTDARGEALLTLFLAGSLARTSASQEEAQESTASEADFGRRWPALFAKYNRDTRSWKTAQLSLPGASDEFSETWPRWGLMRDGDAYPLKPMAHGTSASGSGLLPTLRATDGERGGRGDLLAIIRGKPNKHCRMPTLTVSGNYNRKGVSPTSGDGLATVLGGPLNPDWCEWFMGWPIGWTASAPLETGRFRQWLEAHGRH